MGNTDANDALEERRRFVRRLRAHEDVRRLTFTRDGFRTVLLELEPDAGFRDRWRRTATRLGYTVERPDTNETPAGWSGNVWRLDLAEADASRLSAWAARVRDGVDRVSAFVARLLGRSGR